MTVETPMKTYNVPHSDLTVSSVVLGLMRIAKMSDTEIQQLYGAAVDAGITMIDHADLRRRAAQVRGALRGGCETLGGGS
jgi:predicted oxidoreductase